jgi:hypothetical protein
MAGTHALTLFDYCDKGCSVAARAYVMVQMPSGNTLAFCKHCYESLEAVLLARGAVVVADIRHELGVAPGVSAAS